MRIRPKLPSGQSRCAVSRETALTQATAIFIGTKSPKPHFQRNDRHAALVFHVKQAIRDLSVLLEVFHVFHVKQL